MDKCQRTDKLQTAAILIEGGHTYFRGIAWFH